MLVNRSLPEKNLPAKALVPGALISPVHDLRFRALLTRTEWNRLPNLVQKRFSKRLSADQVALYAGRIVEVRFSTIGWLLAQTLRLIKAPLPLYNDIGASAIVVVADDPACGGQHWTRIYNRKNGFPQTVNSAKRFAGITGLEEHIGYGIAMALKVNVIEGGLRFVSDHYFWRAGAVKIRLPKWMTPGQTEVCHTDRGGGEFDFTLCLTHPWFGELVYQAGRFADQ
jgi:Domain of unknown function (DUF4166)